MKRRSILKYTAFATGAAIGAPLISVILSGCQAELPDKWADYQPKFFSSEEFPFIKDIVDLILPKTDSPSASEVGVHVMIDQIINTVYEEENKTDFRSNFDALVNHLSPSEGEKIDPSSFLNLKAEDKLKQLQAIHHSKDENLKVVRDAFLDIKQQCIAYYLSTEEIGTQYLNYLPVPGEYQACIPLADVGNKAWAL